ncbi:MAG TPA: hypothetical protein VF158_04275 [Longimicrobiales bacterium]
MRNQGPRKRRIRWLGLPRRARDIAITRALAGCSQPGVRIEPVEPRETGSIYGPEFRAWRVTVGTGRTYRVAEFGDAAGAMVLSDRGLRLACECTTAMIRRGHCEHAAHVARRIGGRDLLAEMWAQQDRKAGGAR